MAYVITEPCIVCKDRACVPACPVDCIHEGAKMLYIQPDECICCSACVPVCPVGAIVLDEEVPEKWRAYIQENADFFKKGERCRCH